jgi:formate hydrogenlyase subunit 3/multisubunit Na+/H+ antiporter MnhD subunit
VLRLFERVLLIDVVICGISLLVWFFLFEHTVKSLSNILVVLGAITIVIGAYFVFGEKKLLANLDYQWGRSVSGGGPQERKMQDIEDLNRSYKHSTPFFIAGLIGIGLGILIHILFG